MPVRSARNQATPGLSFGLSPGSGVLPPRWLPERNATAVVRFTADGSVTVESVVPVPKLALPACTVEPSLSVTRYQVRLIALPVTPRSNVSWVGEVIRPRM